MMLNNPSLSKTLHNSNDENVMPNAMKQLLSSSSSSLSKSKKGLTLKPVMNGSMNTKPSSSLSSGNSFPKTPSGGGKVGGGRRKALGDISNRKAGINNSNQKNNNMKNNSVSVSSTKISKLSNGLSHITIHDDSTGKSSSGGLSDGTVSLKKSTKKKRKNVTFNQQICNDDMKDNTIETKMMEPIQSIDYNQPSMIYDESESCMSRDRNTSDALDDDDDIDEVPLRIETNKVLDDKAIDDDDLLHVDDDTFNFDIVAYRRRKEMKEFEKWEQKVLESEARELQNLYNDDIEVVDTCFVDMFGDEAANGLVPYVDDDNSDHFDRSKYNIGLDDVSI